MFWKGKKILWIPAFAGMTLLAPFAFSNETVPIELKDVGITEHLGQSISLDRTFVNEEGKEVKLQSFFDGKRPVILLLVYYNCPNICHYLLDGFSRSIQSLSQNSSWTVGNQFQVVAVSIDPKETSQIALEKKKALALSDSKLAGNFHLLVGKEENIQALAKEIGFSYVYDKDQKEFAHSAAIYFLSPLGKISRYLYGIQFEPRDLKLALLEAAEGKLGNVVDKILLFCYHYDPKGRKYAIFAQKLMSIAGLVTILAITCLLLILSQKKSRIHL